MKAQASVEYIMLIGILLVVIIPLFYYASEKSSNTIRLNQAEDVVSTVAKTADNVYSTGPGTKKYLWITIPSGIISSEINNTIVLLKLQIFGGVSDIYDSTISNVTGSLPIDKGLHKIAIETLDTGVVLIGELNDTTPPVVVWTSPSGTISYNEITLQATTNENAVCRYDSTDLDYDSMNNYFIGSSYTHTSYVGILSEGNHIYYARCKDSAGNVMTSSAKINFTINTSLEDTDNPIVDLLEPPNGSIRNFYIVRFGYNVNDETSGIASCTLTLRGLLDSGAISEQSITDTTISEEVENTLTLALSKGNYTWNTTCMDNSENLNKGVSETWWLRINVTGTGEGIIESCRDLCLSIGYVDGACDSSASCPHFDDATYEPEGDVYCTGGAQADTCCCTY